jgi:hypothetical protein
MSNNVWRLNFPFRRALSAKKSDDRFELVSFAAGRQQSQRFQVTISSRASEGQRI